MVQRWTLHDPLLGETYVFPVNPNAMTSPQGPRSLTVMATAPNVEVPNGAGRVIESNQDPYEWQFTGFIRTQDHHDALHYWCTKVTKVTLTDHLNRDWSIRFTHFDPDEQRPRQNQPWRFNYTVKAIMYGPA